MLKAFVQNTKPKKNQKKVIYKAYKKRFPKKLLIKMLQKIKLA